MKINENYFVIYDSMNDMYVCGTRNNYIILDTDLEEMIIFSTKENAENYIKALKKIKFNDDEMEKHDLSVAKISITSQE